MIKKVILISFILLKLILQYFAIRGDYELQRDEFLHVDQANHLAWGFLSVPPVTSWISYLIKLLGNSVFWIKFFPALFGAMTLFVVWKAIEELKGNLFAGVLAMSCLTFSFLLRLNSLYQPNSLDILCWTSLFYFLIRYLNANQPKWMFAMAITFAVGFLNKYNITFLMIGLIPAMALSPARKIFLQKYFYLAITLVLLMILPNLLWQYTNSFPVIHHLNELSATQLVHVNRWEFVRSQFLYFPGTSLVVIAGLYALLRYRPFEKYRIFFWSFFITMGVFLFLKAKDYYAIGIYPIYFAFGTVYISSVLSRKMGKVLKPAILILSVVLFIPFYDISLPLRSPAYIVKHPQRYDRFGLLRWEDGRTHTLPQDFADMLGWKELARKVDSLYTRVPDPKKTLVLCDNYGQAGAINYYSKLGIRAVSFDADYVHWFDLKTRYVHLIRVKNGIEGNDEMVKTAPYFMHSSKADSITNPYAREFGTAICVFTDAKININERVWKEVQQQIAAIKR